MSMITKNQVNQQLNHPLGKKPNLNQKQLKNFRMVLQQCIIKQQNKSIYYNIASKQSNWGFSQNQRLIILNVQQKSFGYLSKIPHGYLPFQRSQQILANKQKQKIYFNQVTNIKCNPIKGKISSMSIQWEDKNKKKHSWNFILGSSKIMNDWVGLINSIINNSYNQNKYDQMIKNYTPNKNSQLLTSNQNQPLNNKQNQALVSNNRQNQALTNNNKQNINEQQLNNMNENNNKNANNLNNNQYENRNINKIPSFGNQNNSQYNNNNKSQQNYNNKKISSSSQPVFQSNPTKSLTHNQSYSNKNLNDNSKILQSNSQSKKKLFIPKINQLKKPTEQQIDSQINNKVQSQHNNKQDSQHNNIQNSYGYKNIANQPINQQNYNNNQHQLGYNNQYNFNKKSTPKLLQLPNKNNQYYNQQYQQNSPYQNNNQNQQPPNSFNTQFTTQYQPIQSRKTQYIPQKQVIQSQNDYLSQNPILNTQKSVQPGDFVQELKKFKQKNPQKFDLSNQLSNKKFVQYNHQQNQYQNQYQNQSAHFSKQNVYEPQQIKNSREMINNVHKNSRDNINLNRNSKQNLYNTKSSGQRSQKYLNNNNYKIQQNNIPIQQSRNFLKSNTRKSGLGLVYQQQNYSIRSKSKTNNIGSLQKTNNIGPSSGVQNNYDDQNYQIDEVQLYKPTTNYPQSSKNLNKIRSDFLQRKQQDINYKNYAQSSKSKSKYFKNEQFFQKNQSRSKQNFNSSQNYYQKQDNLSKYSIDKKRQQSIKNLQKVGSKLSVKSNISNNIWNQVWLQTSNPNKKIQIHQQFIFHAQGIVRQLVQQLPFSPSYRKYKPIDIIDNINTYSIDNIIISMHLFQNNQSVNTSRQNISQDTPVLYDQVTYDQLKRQFYNYNLIIGVTNNQGFIKVPLCCYFQYKGILILCKADIPPKYRQIQPYQYKNQFQALQNIIKVRFLFGTFNIYESTPYRGGDGRFIVLWNLKNLIPGIPNSLKNQNSYFRKQLLLQYDQILQDLQTSSQAHAFTLRHIIPELLQKLQSLQTQIVHSKDLIRQMHKVGLSLSYLPNMFQQTNSVYLRKIFMSEIVSCIFTQIIRSQLNHAYSILPGQNLQNISNQALNDIIIDCAHVLINQFFSYSLKAQNIWKIIVHEASKKYHIIVSKQQIIPGYLLSAIIQKNNINCNLKQKSYLKSKTFFIHENVIPRQIFLDFKIYTRRFDMECICPTYSKCKQIVQNQQQNTQNYDHLVTILNLKSRNGFSKYYQPIIQPLKAYLCNFIPYSQQQQYYGLDIYQFLYCQPLTAYSIKSSFLAIKWLIKSNQIQRANQIFQLKFHQLSFWLGQYNASITQFFDFFSMYYASIGEYEQSICLAKSSLINVHKILGQEALPVADKHYQLGNIYFKIGRKNQALKEYNKTKQVLKYHQKTTIPQFGIILLKISLLCLNFGQLTDCIENAIEAQRIFQNNGGNQNQQIQCFQILARVYEVTKKNQDNNSLVEACAKTFNLTQNPKILQRMLKIILLPKLSYLSTQQQKSLYQILSKLQQQTRNSYQQAFNYLHKKAEKGNLKKKIYLFLQNIVQLSDEIIRRDLMRKHISLSNQSGGQAEQMINILEATGIMIGFNFIIGAMKDTYYQ